VARATAVRGAELGPPLGAPAAGESARGPPGGTWDLDLRGFAGAGGLSPGGKIISQDVEVVSLPTALLCEARIDVSVGRLFGGCRGPLLVKLGPRFAPFAQPLASALALAIVKVRHPYSEPTVSTKPLESEAKERWPAKRNCFLFGY
jgi:hypothetical protein